MRVLITGITGFAGSHLAERILAEHPDVAVYGTYRWRSRMENLEDVMRQKKLDVVEGRFGTGPEVRDEERHRGRVLLLHTELTDAGAVEKLISAVLPHRIFHLAAQSFVQSSFDEPAATIGINVTSELNVLEAVRRHDLETRIHIAGSSEEYGLVLPDEVPMKETNPLRPLSPYAVSKVAQDKLGWQYFKSYGMHIVVTRGFNHTGPRRGLVFSTSTFARQIAEIEAGLHEPVIYVGDLTSKRDWTDVRDMARAYWLALEKATPGESYNIGSGRATSVGEMLDVLLSKSKITVRTQEDPARLRPSDVPILWADVSKFQRATGWAPTIPFERTLEDLLDYWRRRVDSGKLLPLGQMPAEVPVGRE
ncbi:MAG: GDP-mannose 4,6-dehydratase [Chloroflexota bacterium]|nr:GDP-mannose 4,6-dehydratase [Chloroflexota bacterium]MDE3194645.1 GDP-mannose 4,6-dehydratase [Chloroflexota bacterium]